jgi:hypothetical protein
MFATLGGKIAANAFVYPSSRGAEKNIAYDAPSRPPPVGSRDALMIDHLGGSPVGVFDFRVGHAS